MPHKIDYEKELNVEQLEVVKNADGPCLVLAGAGSGKTRTIVYRVAYLIEHGVPTEQILLLTFTNKAANEMMTRIGELLGVSGMKRPLGLWGGTFHSVANRLLRLYASKVGYTADFSILDQEDSKALIKACLKELGLDAAGRKFSSPAVVQEIISYARNAGRPISESIARHNPRLEPLADKFGEIAELYESRKRKANAMDFDDLLARLYELLEREPQVRERLAGQFRYILVDEFQDINALQAAIISRLAGPGQNILAVGDDAQSIYSFRAADIKNILAFPKQYPGAKVFRLTINYRSTPEILRLANDIIARNIDQYEKELRSVVQKGGKPDMKTFQSATSEAQFVVSKIMEMESLGTRPREIAVLFRATHHSQALEFELMRYGIDYEYRGGLRFFERAHVKDTLAYLRIVHNFRDEAAWLRILGQQSGIGDTTAGRVLEMMRHAGNLAKAVFAPVEEACGSRAAVGWRDLKRTLEALHAADDDPAALIQAVLKSPYVAYLEAEYPNYQERLEDLAQLGRFAGGCQKLGDFLAEVTLDEGAVSAAARLNRGQTTAGSSTADRIVLSTIHQAKGLEWDAVFVIHLISSGFPNRNALMEAGGLEEERRLFYVAVTRARKHLYLSYPATLGRQSSFGGYEGPSLFLEEIDVSCLKDGSCLGSGHSDDYSADPGYEEPTVDAGGESVADGELKAVQGRMKKVKGDWRNKSFLGDV